MCVLKEMLLMLRFLSRKLYETLAEKWTYGCGMNDVCLIQGLWSSNSQLGYQ